jgi:hypothetical protein
MEDINLFLGVLGAIGTLISIVELIINRRPAIVYVVALALSLAILLFVPFVNSEKEIYQYGPYFFTVSESEREKIGYELIKNSNVPFLVNRSLADFPRRVQISANAVIWSQVDETASIRVVLSDLQGCNRKVELIFSRRLPSNKAEDYRNPSLMEEKSHVVKLDCNLPVKELSIFVVPGTWALSVNTITVTGISKVNLLSVILSYFSN